MHNFNAICTILAIFGPYLLHFDPIFFLRFASIRNTESISNNHIYEAGCRTTFPPFSLRSPDVEIMVDFGILVPRKGEVHSSRIKCRGVQFS